MSYFKYGLPFLLLLASCRHVKPLAIADPRNPASEDLVVIKRADLEKRIGIIPSGKYVSLYDHKGVPMVVQFDDLDANGEWDEAVFLYSWKLNKMLGIQPVITDAPATVKAVVRAHVRHMKKNADNSFGPALDKDTMPVNALPTDFSKQVLPPYLTEGPAWENDKVGFRLYYDVRNGKDIWGKTTNRMVLDEVGTDTSKNYHQQADWGMDVLKVGASLGAGSLALLVPLPNGKDTLVRLGGKNIERVTYEKVADGPVRAICRLHYLNWKIVEGLPPVSITEEIHIWGGQYFYESHLTITGAPAGAQLVTGIVNLKSKNVHEINLNCWRAIYTYDEQSENKDKLGLAVVMRTAHVAGTSTTPNANTDIQNTYIMKANIKDNDPLYFRFYAGWEKSDQMFSTEQLFHAFLAHEMNCNGKTRILKKFRRLEK
ncbi:DUF4861 domain-containing protein [Niastella caeni]|uniref:DUF4861 domain-containing protein n=1 Tax=Niastella caeni TaxID=2569763 RepID=A0A4S8HY00_9BACT|nr:DUF4861 family protein [Niastella caeni]THU39679.1 DUF4861 domain-containing protein [Niastella caeni]